VNDLLCMRSLSAPSAVNALQYIIPSDLMTRREVKKDFGRDSKGNLPHLSNVYNQSYIKINTDYAMNLDVMENSVILNLL
jgi:hypothetical protein